MTAGPSTSGGQPRQSPIPRSKSAGKRVANQQPLVAASDTSTKEVFAEIDALMDRIRGSTAPPGGAPPLKRSDQGVPAYTDPRGKPTAWKPLGFPTRELGPVSTGSGGAGGGASTLKDLAATAPPSLLSSRGDTVSKTPTPAKSSLPTPVFQNRLPHTLGLSVAPILSPPKHSSHDVTPAGDVSVPADASHSDAAASVLPAVAQSPALAYKVISLGGPLQGVLNALVHASLCLRSQYGSASKRSPHHMNEDRTVVIEDLGQVVNVYSTVRTGLISER